MDIDIFLSEREKKGLFRKLTPHKKRFDGKIIIEDKEYIDFSSNDYLNLSDHPAIIKAIKDGIDIYGCGACASRLLSGDSELHHILEEKIAEFKGKEACLLFPSGLSLIHI